MDRHRRSIAIMIEVTNRHLECTHFNLDYSRMPVIQVKMVTPTLTRYNGHPDMIKLHLLQCNRTAASSIKQHKLSSSRRAQTSRTPSKWCLDGNLTYFGRQTSLSKRCLGRHVATSTTSSLLTHVSASCACLRGELCSNFNYKPQIESYQQHLDLYMDQQLS